jgi:hypothetical protein
MATSLNSLFFLRRLGMLMNRPLPLMIFMSLIMTAVDHDRDERLSFFLHREISTSVMSMASPHNDALGADRRPVSVRVRKSRARRQFRVGCPAPVQRPAGGAAADSRTLEPRAGANYTPPRRR